MTNKDKFGEEYFRKRSRYPTAVFKGKDLSFLKYPFWSRMIRKHAHCGKLLDIGCAEGALLKWAERCGYDTYGIDLSQFAINRLSRRTLSRTKLFVANASSLPFVNNYFDIITCFDVLEHLETPQTALTEAHRCLKKGGMFIMSVPNINSRGLKWKGDNWFGYRDDTHLSLLSVVEWENLCQKSAFEIASRFYDTLWDSPYLKGIPSVIQHLIFKPSLLVFYWCPIRFPSSWGENLYIVAKKRRG
ncbi:MAG: putative S-adenosylmethionine-dependent methyltransferase [candidate division WS2 bacterium]|nr:putative S-adenosylmethionine-dependent methyltransferase [Candidatus Psychracetigena formicireducens]